MRHFIYQDEKSHKFWAVEQQGNELHISWGKVGTKGQSQIKSFSDAAQAAGQYHRASEGADHFAGAAAAAIHTEAAEGGAGAV